MRSTFKLLAVAAIGALAATTAQAGGYGYGYGDYGYSGPYGGGAIGAIAGLAGGYGGGDYMRAGYSAADVYTNAGAVGGYDYGYQPHHQAYGGGYTKSYVIPQTQYQPYVRTHYVPVTNYRAVQTMHYQPVTTYRVVRKHCHCELEY